MSQFYEINTADFINSMEAILGNTIGLGNSQLMSFYNVQIMDNKLTPSVGLPTNVYLDRCMILFKDVSQIVWEYEMRNKNRQAESCYGGELYTDMSSHKEFWITCKSSKVLIPMDFEFSKAPFKFHISDVGSADFLALSNASSLLSYLR